MCLSPSCFNPSSSLFPFVPLFSMSVLPAVKDEARVCRMEDNSLRIKNVREDDAGTYSCQATISGRAVKKNLPISVVVNGKSWSHMSLWAE